MRGHGGAELHGLFFKLLQQQAPELAKMVHSLDIKPFSVGSLSGRFEHEEGSTLLIKDSLYSFTIATLTSSLSNTLPAMLSSLSEAPVDLGTAKLEVDSSRLFFQKGLSYFRLLNESVVADKLALIFLSPTCFRHNGKLHLMPQPHLIFNSLANRWQRFSDIPIPIFDSNHLQVLRYNLRTKQVEFKGYKLIGFKGKVEIGFVNDPCEIERWTYFALARFATIAGIGYKTTTGMGQVRLA